MLPTPYDDPIVRWHIVAAYEKTYRREAGINASSMR